ncbi:hypothetical protein GCM10023184_18040 [Flaviaesturariibacter amylovorans]|uniref:Uncharacterized protein n=2 Tax=Flaviaesturariibacter amylovorans TaxID=1084520 RepID=A0ABP8GPW7_9BACT
MRNVRKGEPGDLNAWELELHMQLMVSDFTKIKMAAYHPLLLGPDPGNKIFRQIVEELLQDVQQAPDGLRSQITAKAFRMLEREAKRRNGAMVVNLFS